MQSPTNSDIEGNDIDDIVATYEKEDSVVCSNSDQEQLTDREEKDETNAKADEEITKIRIDPTTSKKRISRNSIPQLNTERLKGSKGIQIIEKYFEGFRFYGHGREREDLNRVMKRLEHWSHRLFPKFHFDDFIEKTEKLGTKKDLQTYIKKYRNGMLTTDEVFTNIGEKEIEEINQLDDEMDQLIVEQIIKKKQVEATNTSDSVDNAFDALINDSINSQHHNNHERSMVSQEVVEKPAIILTEEMKQKIEQKRQDALKKKLAKQKIMEETKM